MQKKMIILLSIIITSIVVGFYCLYYYYPRKISFEFIKSVNKPDKKYDNSQFIGFHYVSNEEELMFWLVKKYEYPYSCSDDIGYDSIFVENLRKDLDFKTYDYIITYQKKLKVLTYSPYLAKKRDLMDYLTEKPLIPTFDTIITDKIYLYQIKKNNQYRAPGP
jgi:hypothetical protein